MICIFAPNLNFKSIINQQMKKLLLTVLLVLVSTNLLLQAQDTQTKKDSTDDFYYRGNYFGAGLNAGLLSGAGLSGRYVYEKGFVFGGTFFAITAGDWFHYNLGAEVQYSFVREQDNRFYAILGLGYYSSTTEDAAFPGNRIANPFRMGVGIGYEWFLNRRFALSPSLSITYFPTTSQVIPIPQVGLFMYFK